MIMKRIAMIVTRIERDVGVTKMIVKRSVIDARRIEIGARGIIVGMRKKQTCKILPNMTMRKKQTREGRTAMKRKNHDPPVIRIEI